jgi:molybdopterin biosynthesis enzyme
VKIKNVPINQAVGHILLHNQAGPDGRKALKKGRLLTVEDITTLAELGITEVFVAILGDQDVGENEAAYRLGECLATARLARSRSTTGRVNLIATSAGVLKVKVEALMALNDIPGVTLATLPNHRPVQPKSRVGTVKIIPYALPCPDLQAAEAVIQNNFPLLEINPFTMRQALLITTGSEMARDKIIAEFTPALRARLSTYHTELIEGPYVPESEPALRQALDQALADRRVEMVLIAGETSIMDSDDLTPRAIKAIGGEIVHHGVPVEPGNLFLLAYRDGIPIVGAPGCARSKKYNVVDMILPRLASGERLRRQDLIALGHGGYLQ